jgi:hypothetical protein
MMNEKNDEKQKVLSDLRKLWLEGNPILRSIYSSWEELESSVEERGGSRQSAKSPDQVTESLVIKENGTGGSLSPTEFKEVVYPFEQYEVKLRLSPNNEFIAITEIRAKKDFVSYKQKVSPKGFHDVESYYPK